MKVSKNLDLPVMKLIVIKKGSNEPIQSNLDRVRYSNQIICH